MDLGSRDAFDRMGTLGIEEEFFVVDDAGRPTSGTDELVYENEAPAPITGDVDHELFKFVIETQTSKLDSPDEARNQITAVRDALVDNPIPLLLPDHRVSAGPHATPGDVRAALRRVEGIER